MNGPFVVLSGACGTELERRGAPTPLPLWSAAALLEAPDLVREVHRDYVRAGADVVTANTFRTIRRTLARAGLATTPRDLVATAVRLAREGIRDAGTDRPVRVAGSVAPLEDCFRPDLVPGEGDLAREHRERADDLVASGADLALVETMNTVREAVAALRACAAAGLPAAVSFTCVEGPRLPSGETLAEAVRAMRPLAPLAIGVNCCATAVATAGVEVVRREAPDVPAMAYANGVGVPDDAAGWRFVAGHGASREAYRDAVRRWIALGARWIGGCCGTTPDYVADVRGLVDRAAATRPR